MPDTTPSGIPPLVWASGLIAIVALLIVAALTVASG